jgi:hypothetical protein
MNPDRIYSQYRDDALAKQATAAEYNTFVAMPFGDRFSYRSREIYTEVIQAAASKANELNQAARRFAVPKRIDDSAGTAVVITESIVTEILFSHLFIGDLTFANAGVLLEVGIAMGLKPNPQIILITQGDLRDLHFDIRNNNVISYNPVDAIAKIAQAMIEGAKSFEANADCLIQTVTRSLTPDAVTMLRLYGILQMKNRAQSLHLGVANIMFPNDNRGPERFEQASRELLQKGLIYTEYKVKAAPGADMFGMHATELGWVLIRRMWPENAQGAAS